MQSKQYKLHKALSQKLYVLPVTSFRQERLDILFIYFQNTHKILYEIGSHKDLSKQLPRIQQ